MGLKNITAFEDFKQILEKSIPDDFSNKTGFKQSLVGRAVFGILRYFKKGIQLGKLEYYKRRLENEYFAAILRFCAYKGIDLKNPIEPAQSSINPQEEVEVQKSENEKIALEKEFCDILGMDFKTTGYENNISSIKNKFEDYKNDLTVIMENVTNDEDKQATQKMMDFADKMINCCNDKIKINKIFAYLEANPTLSGETASGYLNQIYNFLNGPSAKSCSKYKGTSNEQLFLRSLSGSTDASIQGEITKILPLFEFKKYNNFELIEEAITSGINKSINISQMLGDQLNYTGKASKKVKIWDYLNNIGITNIDDIKFVELADLFRAHKDWVQSVSSENFLNHAGIRKIQYAVSEIIFYKKPTPDYRGINPGEGGMTDYNEDTSLRKSWEKKVEFVNSEFAGFFDFTKMDPFVLLNLKDALRGRQSGSMSFNMNNEKEELNIITDQVVIDTNAAKLGLEPLGNSGVFKEGFMFVFTLGYGGRSYYAVFTLNSKIDESRPQVYRYIGAIDFNKIITDKAYEKDDFDRIVSKYSSAIWDNTSKPDMNKDFLTLLKLPVIGGNSLNPPDIGANYNFESIYMSQSSFKRIFSKKEGTISRSLRFLYNYVVKSTGAIKGSTNPFKPADLTATDFKLKILSNTGNLENINDLSKVKEETKDKLIPFKTGQIYSFLPGWSDKYFPDGYVKKTDYISSDKQRYLNDTPYNKIINLN